MRLAQALLAVTLAGSVAGAEPSVSSAESPAVTSQAASPLAVGIAVNAPFRWQDADSVGFSGYVAFADHHALRINVASWAHHGNIAANLIGIAVPQVGDEAEYRGRVTDVGVGYQYYSRGLFDGATLEAGLLRRALDTRVEDHFASPAIVETNGTGYAGRVLVGWSWLWARRVFLATAIGVSVGRYAGSERTAGDTVHPDYMTRDFVRYDSAVEAYLRVGLAFGL